MIDNPVNERYRDITTVEKSLGSPVSETHQFSAHIAPKIKRPVGLSKRFRMNGSPGTSEEQLSSFREFVLRTRRHREFWDTVPASSVALLSGVAFCLLASIGAISQLASAHVSIAAFWVGAGATGMFGAVIHGLLFARDGGGSLSFRRWRSLWLGCSPHIPKGSHLGV